MTSQPITSEMSTLLKVPNKVLMKLVDKELLCIGSIIHNAVISKEDIVIINIGIGTLSVDINTMQCKFIPSREFKSVLKQSITNGVDPVECALEQAVIDKLTNLCDSII